MSKYFKTLIKRMEKHGYYYSELDCYKGYYCFRCNGSFPLVFSTQKEIANYLKNTVFDESF